MKPKELMKFRDQLLNWYDQHKRDLPWRRTSDPYAIWVSEIMLQQTTVEAVKDNYYPSFLKKYPTLKSITKAPIDDLLQAWAGLGYYNRIRNFKKATIKVLEDFQGKIPQTYEELIQLPGLGPYAAAAISSIAFNYPASVVDGNVMRVISRLDAYAENILSTKAKKYFQSRADDLLEINRPGDFNQAMMELGATICTPKNSACMICPVKKYCQAYLHHKPDLFPVKIKKVKFIDETSVAYIIKGKDQVLFHQRAYHSVNKGMWEFPQEIVENEMCVKNFSFKKIKSLKARQNIKLLKPVKHSIMNKRMKIYPILLNDQNILKNNSENPSRWLKKNEWEKLPLSTITKKILKAIPANEL